MFEERKPQGSAVTAGECAAAGQESAAAGRERPAAGEESTEQQSRPQESRLQENRQQEESSGLPVAEGQEVPAGEQKNEEAGRPRGRKSSRKSSRKRTHREEDPVHLVCRLCVIFAVCTGAVAAIVAIAQTAVIVADPGRFPQLQSEERAVAAIEGSGIPEIAAALVGLLLLVWLFRRAGRQEVLSGIFARHGRGKVWLLLAFLVLSWGMDGLLTPIVDALEKLLNSVGLTMSAEMDWATGAAQQTPALLLYGILIAPVVEELICRGMIMGTLKSRGKVFAIACSALLFGLLHGNMLQIPSAAVMGLFLGYLAMEYSIGWAIALHIGNNALSFLESRLLESFPGRTGERLDQVISLLCVLGSVAILALLWRRVAAYCRQNRSEPGTWTSLLHCGWFWVIVVFSVLSALMGLQSR